MEIWTILTFKVIFDQPENQLQCVPEFVRKALKQLLFLFYLCL